MRVRKLFLACGVLSSLLYVAMNLFIPTRFPGYSLMSQAVSELSAIGAPTRSMWIAGIIPYNLLLIVFGVGVWLSAYKSRALKVAGGAFIVHGIVSCFWPPMHLRGDEFTLTDTLHIAWTLLVAPLFALEIGF